MNDIIEGWYNHLKSKITGEVKQIWKDKIDKCSKCKGSDEGKSDFCKDCGCYIPAKIKSHSKCPRKNW